MKWLALILLLLNHGLPGSAQKQPDGLTIVHVVDSFYMFTTYKSYKGTVVPSNSMYLVTSVGVILFDTPWDPLQFQPLLDSIAHRHGKQVILCIATHSHSDRTAGLDYYKAKGISTLSSKQTYDLCARNKEPQAAAYFTNDTMVSIGGYSWETFYPGPGHAPDNIVIWFPKQKILYGGCLIKSIENQDLGNVADADLNNWPMAIERITAKYPDARLVVPGHFGGLGKGALAHTLQLLRKKE